MPRKSDEILKDFVQQVGILFDARIKTWEINFKEEIKAEIKASEARIRKDMATKDEIKRLEDKMATKDDIKNMATKQDIIRLEQKIDETNSLRKLVEDLRKRLDKLETELAMMKGKN